MTTGVGNQIFTREVFKGVRVAIVLIARIGSRAAFGYIITWSIQFGI